MVFNGRVNKAVIPAASMGTRLLPATKHTPKEMLPIFALNTKDSICVKPLLQVIFEQLFDSGIREYCFIVGRGKESIYDHFTADGTYLKHLIDYGRRDLADEMSSFYEKVNASSIIFINQPKPEGFGEAVLRAKPFINEPFLVQAGDTMILSNKNKHLTRLLNAHEKYGSDATFLVKEVENTKPFGIIKGEELESGIIDVKRVIEKPNEPPSNLAITAVYIFTPAIFNSLKSISRGVADEVQLTDAIQNLIHSGKKVIAVKLDENELWLDVGNPKSYWDVLNRTFFSVEKV